MYPGERFNSLSHLAGLVLAIHGAGWLLQKTLRTDDWFQLAGAAIFSVTVILLYAASTIYHSTREPVKSLWQRIDHCSIYLLIAGTVTPFILRSGIDVWAWGSLCLIWSLSGFGIWCELRATHRMAPSVWLYIGLGWIGVISVLREWRLLSTTSFLLLLAGAMLYTAGTVFYRNTSKFRHAHGTWHLFVLGGTICHYLSIGSHML